VLWGTGGLTGTLLARATGLSPTAVADYRLLSGGILVVAFLVASGRRLPRTRPVFTRVIVIGLLSALFQGCYFTAVSLTSVSLATLFTIGMSPVVVLAVEQVTGRRRVDRLAVATVCLALTGLGLLVGLPHGGVSPVALLAGAGLSSLSAAGFAAVTLVSTRRVPGLDELTTTGYGFTLGGLVLLPMAVSTGGLAFDPGPAAISLLILLATGPTAVAYTLYFRGLRAAAASTAAMTALLEPLTGVVLAALVLGERLGAGGLVGAVLLGVAVILEARRR
jgi:DME family drug/metabolite transporter